MGSHIQIGKALLVIEQMIEAAPDEIALLRQELNRLLRYWNKGRSYPPIIRAKLRECGFRQSP